MEDDVAACEHDWQVVRMVLDWRGTLSVLRCTACSVEAVEPASGDLRQE